MKKILTLTLFLLADWRASAQPSNAALMLNPTNGSSGFASLFFSGNTNAAVAAFNLLFGVPTANLVLSNSLVVSNASGGGVVITNGTQTNTGPISASAFYGNGSALTGVTVPGIFANGLTNSSIQGFTNSGALSNAGVIYGQTGMSIIGGSTNTGTFTNTSTITAGGNIIENGGAFTGNGSGITNLPIASSFQTFTLISNANNLIYISGPLRTNIGGTNFVTNKFFLGASTSTNSPTLIFTNWLPTDVGEVDVTNTTPAVALSIQTNNAIAASGVFTNGYAPTNGWIHFGVSTTPDGTRYIVGTLWNLIP